MPLTVTYASMASGKSTALLQYEFDLRQAGMKVALLTAGLDNRSGRGVITSRLGLQQPADTFDENTSLLDWAVSQDTVDCILVDEAQFTTPSQAHELHQAAHLLRIPVRCYGLRTDFQGNPFPGMATLLSLADEVIGLTTVCSCGARASMNERMDASGRIVWCGDQVLIGGNDRYRPVCPTCFYRHREQRHMEPSLQKLGYAIERVDAGYTWSRHGHRVNQHHPFKHHIDAVMDAWNFHHSVAVHEAAAVANMELNT